ncbi:MAG TPA: hypothetical protein VN700_04830 [Vicinamibacterales bacterium]|nr:hypothetical protein [Vicinamibacterales bacterium]
MKVGCVIVCVVLTGTGLRAGQAPVRPEAHLSRLAIELAVDRDPTPILLGPDRANPVAVVYDRFTRAHHVAREAVKRNAALDPAKPPSGLIVGAMLVIANPLSCGGRAVTPTDVNIERNTQPVGKWLPASGSALQKLLPGVPAPPGSIGVQFAEGELRSGQTVRISYADTVCSGSSRQVSIPVTKTDPRILERPQIEMPPDQPAPQSSITLTLAGVIDLDGHIRYATAPEATTPFGKAALAAANKMKFDPSRVNGSPVPWTAGVIVTFGAAAAPPPTEGGSTADIAGLSAATSQCESSADDMLGRFVSRAIRIGGRADGAGRIKQYLNVLRGPAGQGIRYEFTGPVLMGGKTIEGVEIRYAGLAEPVKLYFDPSLEDRLLAPKGFICAAPLR